MNHSSKEQAKAHDEPSDMDVLPAMDQADPMFRRIAMQSSPFEILRTDMAGGKHLNMNQEKLYEQKSKQKSTPVHYQVEIMPSATTSPRLPSQSEILDQQQEQHLQRLLVEAREEFMVDSIPEIEEDAIDPVDPVYRPKTTSVSPSMDPTTTIVEQIIQGCCQLKWTEVQLGSEWNIQLRTLTGIEEMEWELRLGQQNAPGGGVQDELVVMFHLISGQNEQWFLDIVDQLVSLCPVLEEEEHHHSRIDVVGSLYPQCTASNPEELEQLFQDMKQRDPEQQQSPTTNTCVRHNAIQAANRLVILSQDKPTRVQWLTRQNETLQTGLEMMLYHEIEELQCASLFITLTFLAHESHVVWASGVQTRTRALRAKSQEQKQPSVLGKLAIQLQRYGC